MSADKYQCILSRQIKAIVYLSFIFYLQFTMFLFSVVKEKIHYEVRMKLRVVICCRT